MDFTEFTLTESKDGFGYLVGYAGSVEIRIPLSVIRSIASGEWSGLDIRSSVPNPGWVFGRDNTGMFQLPLSLLGGGGGSLEVCRVWEEKTQGTDGGTFELGADRTRVLTNIDTVTWAALFNSQITGAAGAYLLYLQAPAFLVGGNQALLWNCTTSSALLGLDGSPVRGSSEVCDMVGYAETRSTIFAPVVFASETTFEVRHRCSVTRNTDGFGQAAGIGAEVYTNGVMIKIG